MKKKPKVEIEQRSDKVIVTTSRGVQVECLPTQAMIDELQARYNALIEDLEIPTRTVVGVGNDEIDVAYTDESIKNSPDEDKAAWGAYKVAVAEIEAEKNEHLLRLLATRCTKIVNMPSDEVWIPEHEWLYGAVPDSPYERLYHYFKTEVVGTQQDGFTLVAGIYRASGLDQEVLDQIEASFRKVEKQERVDTGEDPPDTE